MSVKREQIKKPRRTNRSIQHLKNNPASLSSRDLESEDLWFRFLDVLTIDFLHPTSLMRVPKHGQT